MTEIDTTAADRATEALAPALTWTLPSGPALGRLLLAHGAGAGQDSAFLERLAKALGEAGIAVARFEFAYMAARRGGGKRRPPPKAERLVPEYRAAISAFLADPVAAGPALIAGKSMGGRVAAMAAAGDLDPAVLGVAVYGYPFHPAGIAETWRLQPLEESHLPVLLCQGERDDFGSRAEIEDVIALPESVSLRWIEDGSHDFGPRGQSPATLKSNIAAAVEMTALFLADRAGSPQP